MTWKLIGWNAGTGSPQTIRLVLLLVAFAVLAAFAAACGSDGISNVAHTTTGDKAVDADAAPIFIPDRTLPLDDLIAAGWKKSKQYSTETVPGTLDIWYGFFNKKDIEVRFYSSHQDALTLGVESADGAIERRLRQGGPTGASTRGAGSAGVTRYEAYLIAGNTVMLCEFAIETCTDLVDLVSGP